MSACSPLGHAGNPVSVRRRASLLLATDVGEAKGGLAVAVRDDLVLPLKVHELVDAGFGP